MITTEILEEYNSFRRCSDKSVLCHAPFTNIYFNQSGNGTTCCNSSMNILGNYPRDSIREMWFGDKANELREAIRNNDLSGGCSGCAYQLMSRNFTGHLSVFDRYADKKEPLSWFQRITRGFKPQSEIKWPKGMEFSLTNVCNLECVMCNGNYSSVIRRRREKLPPMKSPYNLGFVEQLEPFLPSLSVAKFYGGEPFLVRIYYEIWERIARLNPAIEVHITTNATTLTKRAKEVLDNLNCHLIVSIDSLKEETYEQIRKNASYEQVMQNVAYLKAYSAKEGRTLSMAVCPMQQNWPEIPQMVEYCNQHHIIIVFNTVSHPIDCSLRSMSAAELAQVVDYWNGVELPADDWLTTLNRNRFRSVINQATQWRGESRHEEDVISSTVSHLFKPTLEQIDDPGKEMSRVFANMLLVQTQKREASEQSTARYSVIDARLKSQLNEFLDKKRAELSEEVFLRHYFTALKEAYLSVNQKSCDQKDVPKGHDMLSKIDSISSEIMKSDAREAIVGLFVKQELRKMLGWLENNSLETILRAIGIH